MQRTVVVNSLVQDSFLVFTDEASESINKSSMSLLANVGIFVYPLGVCSFVAVFITIERLIALRTSTVVPKNIMNSIVRGTPNQVEPDIHSAIGRILDFYLNQRPNSGGLNAFARLEVSRLERGFFLLEVVIGAAPLLGLLGTVTGLTQVFGNFFAENGLADPNAFTSGIAMALNTTILGLAIAIPALAAHAYLLRRVDLLAAQISVGVEYLNRLDMSD